MLSKRPCGDAVCAARIVIPERGAALACVVQNAVRIEIEHGVFCRINQTDDIKDRAQTLDIVGDRRLVRRAFACAAEGRIAALHLLCISQTADHADIVTGGERRPERVHPDVVPVLLAPDRQKQAERKLVVLGRCGLESGSEPRNIGRPQQSETVRFMHVQYRALLLTRTASVGYYDGTGRNVILKLHIAAAGDKEIQLFLDIIQLALGAVAVRYSALLQQLSRQALCVAAEHLIGGKRRQ